MIADVSGERMGQRGEAPARQVGAHSLYAPTDCIDEDAIAADAALARISTNYRLWFNILDHTSVSR